MELLDTLCPLSAVFCSSARQKAQCAQKLHISWSFHLCVLTTLIWRPNDANQLPQLSAALSPLPFVFIMYLSRFSWLYYIGVTNQLSEVSATMSCVTFVFTCPLPIFLIILHYIHILLRGTSIFCKIGILLQGIHSLTMIGGNSVSSLKFNKQKWKGWWCGTYLRQKHRQACKWASLRPGAHQSSKAAFGKSAFAKTCYNVLSFVKDTTWRTPIEQKAKMLSSTI